MTTTDTEDTTHVTETTKKPANGPPTKEITRRKPITEDIDPVLIGLIEAENRSRYADEHDIRYRNGSALVVIEVKNTTSIPFEYDVKIEYRVSTTDNVMIQAYVAVEDLQALVRDPAVKAVRLPKSPKTVNTSQ